MKRMIILILTAILLLVGCGRQNLPDENSEKKKDSNTEQIIPVSFYSDSPIDMAVKNNFKVIKDKIYYIRSSWSEELQKLERVLYCKPATEDIPETEIGDFRNDFLIEYLADLEGNVYTLYLKEESGNTIPYLKKSNHSGDEIYCVSLQEQLEGKQWNDLAGGAVDSQGRLCFFSLQKEYYLFDAQGQFLRKGKAQWSDANVFAVEEEGIVNAGQEGCFLYASLKDRVLLRQIDMQTGELGKEVSIESDNGGIPPKILSGYEKGILIAEGNTLWTVLPSTGNKTICIDFLSEYVNIMGNYTEQIGIHDDGTMMIYLYDYQQYVSEQALIQFFPKDQMAPKQTVRVALRQAENERMLEWIKRFNRQSMEYKVIIEQYQEDKGKGYNMLDLYKNILKDQGADIIDISNFSADELVSKGMLEDLGPYFAQSGLINKEMLLPNVWRAGLCQGKMYSVSPAFSIQSLLVKAENIEGSTWTLEEFIALGDKYPQSSPYCGFRSFDIFDMLMTAGIDSFVNWELRKADFEQEIFKETLEFSRRIDAGTISNILNQEDRIQSLLNGKWITSMCYINDMKDFLKVKEDYGENMVMASYPNEESIPWYPMACYNTLSISSSSDQKEGAWAFLEYLLSEEIQKNYTKDMLPVRKDAFDHVIRATETISVTGKKMEFTEEDVQKIYDMAENSYNSRQWDDSGINDIILDEIISFFEDGKSAEETARIIQNRVQLYFDE